MQHESSEEAPHNENLVLVFVPPLWALLQRAQHLKGAPLSQSEVLRIRDAAVCVSMRDSVAAKIEEARGYADIDAKNAWQDWNDFGAPDDA